jgi:signal transduction histidine kinase/CheY-like chemotaxis protein
MISPKSLRGLVRSRFGHRLLVLFICCALLPTAAVAVLALYDVTRELDEQARRRLQESSKSIGFAIFERLLLLESQLPVLGMASELRSARLSDRITPSLTGRFVGVERVPPSSLSTQAREHLARGQALVSTTHSPGRAPRIHLISQVSQQNQSLGILKAEINQSFLWGIFEGAGVGNGTALVVLDDSNQVLYSSLPATRAEEIGRRLRAAPSRSFEWESGQEPQIASYSTIFMKPRFMKPKWTIVLSEAKADVLGSLTAFRSTFLPVILLSLLAVALLSIHQIRRSITPLHALHEGTRRIAMRDFDSRVTVTSGDEFEQVADAFNTMAEQLGRQFASLAHERAQLEQRTNELARANETLQEQIRERERAEKALLESEEQLRHSQKMEAIGTLAGGVAHDFNNLLTVISSYSELAMISLEPSSPLRTDMEQIFQASVRAASLTRQLLAFSRKQVLHPEAVELNELVSGVEKMLRRLIGPAIEIRRIQATPFARVKADPSQIDQVIVNLAVNARDAMPQGGELTIETGTVRLDRDESARLGVEAGDWVLLSLADTGIGMDEATRARIFEPFFTTKEPGKGTGLGLSTVYGIVRQSGGCITVESEPGKGTKFRIYLPALEFIDAPLQGEPAASQMRPGSETILLVEDDEPVRVLADRLLRDAGYLVLTASHAGEALLLSEQHDGPIHLLLSDVVMPLMSGWRLADRLRPNRPEMRVLFMSGHTDHGANGQGSLHADTPVLQKPFGPEALHTKVRGVLDPRNSGRWRCRHDDE